ncbi:MAG TPA: glycosyltransferase, partial [Phaeodactylibacter sp.]|nr:glycosyltransferase [Phaeodactylibacter sp.]
HDEVRALPSWEKVTEYGFVGREKRNELLARSKIGLSTLMPIPNYKLAYSVKMFEYMAAGIPSIISDFPMWREIIEETNCGICVNPEDPKAISKAINYLLENDDIAKQMGENGRRAVEEKYNWATQEKKLIHLYQQILSK